MRVPPTEPPAVAMNKLASPYRWYTPWRPAADPLDDPADLGTAFGLDLSMAPPAGATGLDDATPDPHRGGWVQRWVARRRAST
jgi:hypothetical protein